MWRGGGIIFENEAAVGFFTPRAGIDDTAVSLAWRRGGVEAEVWAE